MLVKTRHIGWQTISPRTQTHFRLSLESALTSDSRKYVCVRKLTNCPSQYKMNLNGAHTHRSNMIILKKRKYWAHTSRTNYYLKTVLYRSLLYGPVSQGQGNTKFTNLMGWKRCWWPWSRLSHLDRHLDRLKWKSCKLKCKIIDCFHLTIFISVSAKKLMRKKSKEDEKTLEELHSAHHRSQAKRQLR